MPRRPTPDPLAAMVARRIQTLRHEKALTLSELAQRSEMSKGHLSNVERGLVVVDIRTLQKLARGLDVRLHDLLIFPEEERLLRFIDALRNAPPGALPALENTLNQFSADNSKTSTGGGIQRRRRVVRHTARRT